MKPALFFLGLMMIAATVGVTASAITHLLGIHFLWAAIWTVVMVLGLLFALIGSPKDLDKW